MTASHGTSIDSRLRAIDPPGCACAECLTGEYRPADQASDDEIRALFLGLLRDHTGTQWNVVQNTDRGGFDVSGPITGTVHAESIVLPVPVDDFRFTANHEVTRAIALGATYID